MQGFTAIELMVVVSIVAILAALAAPSFTPLIENWRVRTVSEQLRATLYYARSEAIKRGGRVVVQKLSNNGSCTTAVTTTEWDCGWFVCHDTNDNGSCGATEPILQRNETPSQVQVSRSGGGATIKFNRWGLVSGNWPGFSIVPTLKSTTSSAARGLCMSSGGSIRVISPEEMPCT